MYVLSSRSRTLIEIPVRDFHDLVFAAEALGSTNQAFTESTSNTTFATDMLTEHVIGVTADTITWAESVVTSIDAPIVSDLVVLSDVIDGSFQAGVLSDTLMVADLLVGSITAANLVDAVGLSDVAGAVLSASSALSDITFCTTAVTAGWTAATGDTVSVVEALQTAEVPTAMLDALRATCALSGVSAVSVALFDSATVRDAIGYGFVESSIDPITVIDALSGTMTAYVQSLSDVVSASTTLSGSLAIYADLSDSGHFSDSANGALTLVGVLSDSVTVGDTLRDQAYRVILVTNAETGASSTYTVTPIVSGLAEFDGVLYLAAEDGLYALDATVDESGAVTWTLQTGYSDFGSRQMKRPRDVDVQARLTGNVALRVQTLLSGAKTEHQFMVPVVWQNQYRGHVTKVGRGLASVYWGFGLQGAGPAEIDKLSVNIGPLLRRR